MMSTTNDNAVWTGSEFASIGTIAVVNSDGDGVVSLEETSHLLITNISYDGEQIMITGHVK
jgi:hypothetical protein